MVQERHGAQDGVRALCKKDTVVEDTHEASRLNKIEDILGTSFSY